MKKIILASSFSLRLVLACISNR